MLGREETAKSLWAACATAWASSWGKGFSLHPVWSPPVSGLVRCLPPPDLAPVWQCWYPELHTAPRCDLTSTGQREVIPVSISWPCPCSCNLDTAGSSLLAAPRLQGPSPRAAPARHVQPRWLLGSACPGHSFAPVRTAAVAICMCLRMTREVSSLQKDWRKPKFLKAQPLTPTDFTWQVCTLTPCTQLAQEFISMPPERSSPYHLFYTLKWSLSPVFMFSVSKELKSPDTCRVLPCQSIPVI